MATADRTLMLKLIADVGQPKKELKGLGGALKRAGSAAKAYGKAFAGALVIGGIEKLVDSLGEAERGFREGEDAAARLRQTWRSLGRDTDQLAGVLDTLGGKAIDLGFDDAEVITAFNTFLTKTGSVKKSTAGITAAMNLARAKGITFARAVKLVQGHLGDLGGEFARNRRQARRWAQNHPIEVGLGKISDAWETFVGNFSRGNLNKAFAALGEIATTLGTIIFGGEVAPGVMTEGIVGKFAKIAPKIVDAILGGLTELGGRIQTAWDEQIATVDWGKAIPDAFGTFWNDLLKPFIETLGEKGPIAAGAITAIGIALGIFGAGMIIANAPLLILIGAVAAMVALFAALAENKDFQDFVHEVQGELQNLQHAFENVLGIIGGLIGGLWTQLNNLLILLGLAQGQMASGWNSAAWNQLPGYGSGRGLGEGPTTWPDLPGSYGDAQASSMAAGNGGAVVVNVTAGVGDPVEIGRQVDRVLRAWKGRAGTA